MSILGLLLVPLLGYLIARLAWPMRSLLENLSYGYLIGWPFFTLSLFLGNLLGLNFSRDESTIIILVLVSIMFLITRIFSKSSELPIHTKFTTDKFTITDYLIIQIIIMLLLSSYISDIYRVVSDWDAITLYDFRAQMFAKYGSMSEAITAQGGYFYSYPLHTSLVHAWYYILGFVSPMTYYAGLFISFITVFYYSVRRFSSRTKSLVATLMLIASPHLFWHAQLAYTNLPYSIYLGLGTIFILSYSRSHLRSDALFAAVFTGLSLWMRSVEPFWLINIVVLLGLTLWRRQYLDTLLSLIIFVPLERVWKLFTAFSQGSSSAGNIVSQATGTLSIVTSQASVLPVVIPYFLHNAVKPFASVILLLGIVVAYKLLTRSRDWLGEFMVAGYFALAFYGTYIFALTQPYWNQIPGSLERMMMFISIPIIYIFTYSTKRLYD